MRHKTKSLILKRIAYGEADWIVTFFSRESGRMSGIAKSARKSQRRFGGAIEPGTLVDLQYEERGVSNIVRIEEATVLRSTNGIVKTIERINAMTRAIDLSLSFLQEHQAAPEKFDILNDFFTWLGDHDPSLWDLLNFEIKWLAHCGYRPDFSSCSACDRKAMPTGRQVGAGKGWAFDLDQGGLLCDGCVSAGTGNLFLTSGALKGLSSLSEGAEEMDFDSAVAAGRVVHRYTDHLLGRALRHRPL